MFEMLIFGLDIFELKFATLEPEPAILLGIFESELIFHQSLNVRGQLFKCGVLACQAVGKAVLLDRKSTRLNSSHAT